MREKKTINAYMLIICPGADENVRFLNDQRTEIAPKMQSFMTELHDCVAFGESGNTYCGKWMCASFNLSFDLLFRNKFFSFFVKKESKRAQDAIWSFLTDVKQNFNLNDDDELNLTLTVISYSRGGPLAIDFINGFNDIAEKQSYIRFNWNWRLSFLDPVLNGVFDKVLPAKLNINNSPLKHVSKCVIQRQLDETRAHMKPMVIKLHPSCPKAIYKEKHGMHAAILRDFPHQSVDVSIQGLTLKDQVFDFILPYFELIRDPLRVLDLRPISESRQHKDDPKHKGVSYPAGFFARNTKPAMLMHLNQIGTVMLKSFSGGYKKESQQYLNKGYLAFPQIKREACNNAFNKSSYFMDGQTLRFFQTCFPRTYEFIIPDTVEAKDEDAFVYVLEPELEKWSQDYDLIVELNHMKKHCNNFFKILFESEESPFNKGKYGDLVAEVTENLTRCKL